MDNKTVLGTCPRCGSADRKKVGLECLDSFNTNKVHPWHSGQPLLAPECTCGDIHAGFPSGEPLPNQLDSTCPIHESKMAAPEGEERTALCLNCETMAARLRELERLIGIVQLKRQTAERAASHPPAAPQNQASFWVIERFGNGKSFGYWTGESSRDFLSDIEKAIQFVRREDAFRIRRGWHWQDVQVTEHMYMLAAPPTPEGEERTKGGSTC